MAERDTFANKLSMSQDQFKSVVENLEDLVAIVDIDGKREYVNPSYGPLFGDHSALQGTDSFASIHNDDRERVRRLFHETVSTGIPRQTQFRIVLPDGRVRFMESHGNPIKDPAGRVLKVLVVSRDVTDRQYTEEALIRRNNEASALNSFATELQRCDSIKEVERACNRHLNTIFTVPGVAYLLKPETDLYEEFASWNRPETCHDHFQKRQCWATKSREGIHRMKDANASQLCTHLERSSGHYTCVHASVGRENTQVVLHLQFEDHASKFKWDESAQEQLGLGVATHLASVIDRIRLTRRLEREATTDELTGLFNKRYVDIELQREVARAERNGKVLGVIIGDIDHFKSFNDTHGHEAGNQLLRQIGHFLRRQVRSTDIVSRYGGEEFLVIMLDSERSGIVERAEHLRHGVATLNILNEARPAAAVTLSLGIAFVPGHGRTVDELKQNADTALYRAKELGRNRVSIFGTD